MAQYEKIAALDKELDVQAGLIERLVDQVSYLEEAVLQLERTRAVRRSRNKDKEGSPTPSPSMPGG